MKYFLILLCFCTLSHICNGEIVVKLPVGSVRGKEMISEKGNPYFSFRSIPYAEPPVGNLRFKPPVAKSPWEEDILDATEDGPVCPQLHVISKEYIGNEDCLILNVYTTQIDSAKDKALPVMVFIHGGSFLVGSGSSVLYSARRLIDSGIVLVTLNYRLGSLGFLSTDDSASPGNYGLLDQVEALRWIKKNIQYFGGNIDNISIFGNSAGGASVVYHLLSPLSKGLFHKAFASSGTALCHWAFQPDPLIWAQKTGIELLCPIHEPQKLVDCLRKVPAKNLTESSHSFNLGFLPFVFVPTTDKLFLHDTPINLIEKGQIDKAIPLLFGKTKNEGSFCTAFLELAELSNTQLKQLLKDIIGTTLFTHNAAKLIHTEYFQNVDIRNVDALETALTKVYTEGMIDSCVYRTGQLMAKNGNPTFLYNYDFEHQFSVPQSYGLKKVKGVGHMDDLFMIFDGAYFSSMIKDERSDNMKQKFQQLLINFVKYGHPTAEETEEIKVKWPEVQVDQLWTYHINDELTADIYNPHEHKSYKFWTETIPDAIRKAREHVKDEL